MHVSLWKGKTFHLLNKKQKRMKKYVRFGSDWNFVLLSSLQNNANEIIKTARLPLLLAGKQRFEWILVYSSPIENKLGVLY